MNSAIADQIVVGLASGRVFAGEVDKRTDDERLWLRTTQGGITISRPIDWGNIAVARSNGRELSAAELRTAAQVRLAAYQTDAPAESVEPPGSIAPGELLNAKSAIASARARNTQLCSISIDANVGHWYRTVEANGIVLHLYPLSGGGGVIPVDGTLEVELFAAVSPGSRQGVPLPRIGRWTVRITPDLFGSDGAIFKLPFQAVHPEFDLDHGPWGLVHATLSVPGSGTYEASASMVRIRPYSNVRDESLQLTGQRFFDSERVERWGR
jgi:hypothetical protein